jgi:hypothetical protein
MKFKNLKRSMLIKKLQEMLKEWENTVIFI